MRARIIFFTLLFASLFNTSIRADLYDQWGRVDTVEPDENGNLIIPEGITAIGEKTYQGNQDIISVSLPSTLTNIGDEAFTGCDNLRRINIPLSLIYIGSDAFYGCNLLNTLEIEDLTSFINIEYGLSKISPSGTHHFGINWKLYINGSIVENLNIPFGISEIPEYTFNAAEYIRTLSLPATIKKIGYMAFGFSAQNINSNSNSQLSDIYCYASTPPECTGIPFTILNGLGATLHVPVGTINLYYKAQYWNQFENIIDDLVGTGEDIEPTELTISENQIKLEVGATYKLSASVLPENTTYNIEWFSDNEDVATVSNSGLVTAVKEGSTTITVSCGDLSQSCRVDVGDYEIFFNPTSKTISKGEKSYVGVQVLPNDYFPNEPIRVSSSDPSILQVENTTIMNGYGDIYFTGLEVGKANIIVSYGEKEATCEITVSPVLAEKVVVSPELVELKVGETYQLSASVSPENTTDKTITWVSENPEIVSVSETGLITCKKWGNTSVKAYCGDVRGYCVVHVLQPEIETLIIQPNKVAVEQGETVKLDLIISPDNVPEYSVSVSSSNTSIVTVNKTEIKTGETSFEITGVSVGNATITAKYGLITASCEVTVNPVLAEKIVIEPEMAELKIGETYQLSAKVYPDNTTNKTIEWSSSNQSVVSVNGEGLITAISEGSAVITAKCGEMSAISNITVVKSIIEADQIILNVERAELNIGETLQLETTVLPEGTTDKTVTWKSSNEQIVTVSEAGLVKAISEGNAQITASCGGATTVCEINVVNQIIEAAQIVLNIEETELNVGETIQLNATVLPENATDKSVIWKSSNEQILTVSETGLVKAISEGNAQITASCGGATAVCNITVVIQNMETEQIFLNIEVAELNVGETLQLNATVLPENSTDKQIIWSSSNTNVVSVSETGLVTAIEEGNAQITAMYGDAKAVCNVTVVIPLISAEEIVLNIEEAELNIGETLQLNAIVLPENSSEKRISWSSSNTNVASVSETGLVTAIGEGTANITAVCGSVSTTCQISVTTPFVDVEQIILNIEQAELNTGETLQLEVSILPEDATDKTLTWTSSDPDVASVSQSGFVTALKSGNVEITVSSGDISAVCLISVTDDAGIDSLLANPESKISVYSTDGFLIRKDCKIEDLKTLTKGIYIIVSGKEKYKIYL